MNLLSLVSVGADDAALHQSGAHAFSMTDASGELTAALRRMTHLPESIIIPAAVVVRFFHRGRGLPPHPSVGLRILRGIERGPRGALLRHQTVQSLEYILMLTLLMNSNNVARIFPPPR